MEVVAVARLDGDAAVGFMAHIGRLIFIPRHWQTPVNAISWKSLETMRTPTLLMYAGADRLVNAAGSDEFARRANQSKTVKPGTLTAKRFDGCYHELFNETDAAPVFELLKSWLDARF